MNPLIEILDKDTTIRDIDREMFNDLAEKFYDNFNDNLFKTSIELSEIYAGTNANEWMVWLDIPGIKKYRDKFVKERISSNTNIMLASGDKQQGAVQVRKMLDSSDGDNMSNFIVLRLPDREDG